MVPTARKSPLTRLLPVQRAVNRFVSGRQDLNLRPPDPQSGALPSCATSRADERYPTGDPALWWGSISHTGSGPSRGIGRRDMTTPADPS
ncbi:hypothetical protein FRAHR75_520039 [Frankia sp. Hr75.2]|nr:hypothetical protein FRAHR75_520039 [Frankia sp. Hr75.2]